MHRLPGAAATREKQGELNRECHALLYAVYGNERQLKAFRELRAQVKRYERRQSTSRRIEMSKTGLWLCAGYVLLIAACVAYAFSLDEAKGRHVILQLPIVLQAALADALGMSGRLFTMSWPIAYLVLASPVLLLLYGAGVVCDYLANTDL